MRQRYLETPCNGRETLDSSLSHTGPRSSHPLDGDKVPHLPAPPWSSYSEPSFKGLWLCGQETGGNLLLEDILIGMSVTWPVRPGARHTQLPGWLWELSSSA